MGFLSAHVTKFENFQDIKIERDNARSLIFKGVQVAKSYSSGDKGSSYYSGSTGRYRKYEAFLTTGGNLVIRRRDISDWAGEQTRFYGYIIKTFEELLNSDIAAGGWVERDLMEEIENIFDLKIGEIVE